MSRVVRPAKPPANYVFALLLGAVIAVGFAARTAHAQNVAAPPPTWCVARGDLPPDCAHYDFLACSMSAFLTGGSCVKIEPSFNRATTADVAPVRQKRKAPRRQVSAAQHDKNDKLFREFERWKRTATE